MKKTLLYISTGFVGITLIAALVGKITFEQFGYITPLVLSIIYGIYQKLLSNEKDEDIVLLRNTLSNAYNQFTEEESILESKIIQLQDENKKLISEKIIVFDEVKVDKPKRKRKEK